MSRRIGLLAAGGLAVALVVGGGTAFASIPDSQGIIHGCYDSGGNLKVIDTAVTASCPRGYSELDWDQTGPAGAQGPQGPQGPAGPAGAAGANGSTVLSGTGAPSDTTGNNGDFYIDTAAAVLYGPKANGAWPATGTSLVGPQGPPGPVTAGSLNLQIISSSGTSSVPGTLTADCPDSAPYLLGGSGYGLANGTFVPVQSSPSVAGSEDDLIAANTLIGWSVSGPVGALVVAWAICAQ